MAFKREPFGKRALAQVERWVKGPMFGCRMCGNCLLQETAFICPMECPKGIRNGPCGGSTEERCYVDETRPCMWYKIYDRAFKMGREEMLLEVLPPLDWDKTGTETWGDVARQVRKVGVKSFATSMLSRQPPGTRSSARCASPNGGAATPSTTPPPTKAMPRSWSAVCGRASSSSPARWPRRKP
jgi:hypothetical protein